MPSCESCGVPLRRARYEVRSDGGRVPRCLRCALMYPPLVLRSVVIALVVGTVLTAINQGQLIAGGEFPASFAWKVPLTYLVPYIVSATGALLNARTRSSS